jgi:hypothetical protein
MGLPTEKFWSSAMQHSAGPNFKNKYLGEFQFQTEFESILGF